MSVKPGAAVRGVSIAGVVGSVIDIERNGEILRLAANRLSRPHRIADLPIGAVGTC
jgi:hypothetical protein